MLNSNAFDLSWILKVLRRWIWLIAALTILAAGIAFLITFVLPPVFKSTATLLVEPSKDSQSSTYNNLIAGQQLAITYSQMVTEPGILENVIKQLNLDTTPDKLVDKIEVAQIRDTQLLQITVSDSNADQAQKIANAVSDAFIARVQGMQQERFKSSLKNIQDKIDSLNTNIQDAQTKVDALNLQGINQQVELTHLTTVLTGYRDDYRNVQQNYLNLQQTVGQATGNVYIAQPAQVDGNRAMVTILVGESPISGIVNSTAATLDQVTQSYNQLLANGPALSTAIRDLGLDMKPDQLARNVNVNILPGTNVLHLTVTDSDPEQARRLADAISVPYLNQIKDLLTQPYTARLDSLQQQMSDLMSKINQTQADIKTQSGIQSQSQAEVARLQNSLTEYRSDLRTYQQDYDQTRLTALSAVDSITVTDRAKAPIKPSQNRLLYTALAAFVGLVLGTGLAFILESQDSRIKTPQDVTNKLGLTTLGSISRLSQPGEELVVCSDPLSNVSEDFRVLGTMLRLSNPGFQMRTVLVTSPTPNEGKSLVCANLAVVLAKAGLKVVIVDGDLRLPRVHSIFNVENKDGLAEAIINRSIVGNLQPTLVEGLRVLTSGNGAATSSGVLNSPYLEKLLEEISKRADIVLIDCPPVLALADAAILSSTVDGVLLVLRSSYSESQDAREAVKSLQQVKANVLGVVLNDVPTKRNGEGYYRYYGGRNGNGKNHPEKKALQKIS